MTNRYWPDDLDAHEDYLKTLTEDREGAGERRQMLRDMGGGYLLADLPAMRSPPAPTPVPWYENVIAAGGGAFVAAVIIALLVFAASIKW